MDEADYLIFVEASKETESEAVKEETTEEASEENQPKAQESKGDQAEEKPVVQIDFKTALYIRELEKKVSDYESKISDVREYVKKMESEMEQVRVRSQRDLQKNIEKKVSDFFHEILPVVDNFERCLKASEQSKDPLTEGVRLIHGQFGEILKKAGLERIPALGIAFDPVVHEALTVCPVQDANQDGIVLEEVKAGYKYGETVVRPTQVIVAKAQ
jgi:molecular chaperone GrpE